jgi:hypothetical protein
MSHILLPLIDCPNLQRDLNEINACKLMPAENLPLTQFLLSPQNTNRILETNVVPGNGKLRTVEVVYTPRTSEAEVSDTLSTDCENTNEAGMNSTTYEIDPLNGVEVSEQIEFANIATICKSNPQFIAERVQAMIDGAKRKMETKVSNQAALLYGKFVANGDDDLSEVNTLKTIATKGSDGKFTEDAIQEILYSAQNSGFCSIPFVFGYGDIWKYMQKTKHVCCANSGIDLASFMAENQAMFFSTYRVPAALGGSGQQFLALDAGSLFLLQYNRFAGASGLNLDNSFTRQGTIVDPVSGIEFNYKTFLNPCGEKLNIFVSTAFKVVGLPDDMYSGGDRFEGTNGVLRFDVSNPA